MSDHDALCTTSGNSWLTGILLNGTSVVFYKIMYLSKCTKHVTTIYCRRFVCYFIWTETCLDIRKKGPNEYMSLTGFLTVFYREKSMEYKTQT